MSWECAWLSQRISGDAHQLKNAFRVRAITYFKMIRSNFIGLVIIDINATVRWDIGDHRNIGNSNLWISIILPTKSIRR